MDQNKLFGHHELIRQIFMNIFDNCVKYGQHETSVEIEQRVQEKTDRVLIIVRGTVPNQLTRKI